MEIRDAVQSAARELGYANLKPEQLDVVETFVKGRDVFAVLPTGYGKSLCFGCLPLVFKTASLLCKLVLSLVLSVKSLPQPTHRDAAAIHETHVDL